MIEGFFLLGEIVCVVLHNQNNDFLHVDKVEYNSNDTIVYFQNRMYDFAACTNSASPCDYQRTSTRLLRHKNSATKRNRFGKTQTKM